MNPSHQNPSSSLKSRFTKRFLRALAKINEQRPISSSSPREIFQRYRRIKDAAYKSMACSVRPRRAWSRATLWKLRSRPCRQLASSGGRRLVKTSTITPRQAIMKKTSHVKEHKTTTGEVHHVRFVGQEDELRELIPGSEAMDLCNLLDETAHYIKCLTTQVKVMRKVFDSYSE